MNKLLTVGALSACLTLTMPVATWANDNIKTVETAQFMEELPYVTDIIIKYANAAGVNIREQPNTDSIVFDQTLLNAEFEVVLDIGGWSMITTEDGYAYIKSEYLSDTKVKYSQEDLKILAMILCGECQTNSDQEQRYVGSVFLNRVKSKDFPNTFLGVASDTKYGKQYSSWWDGNAFREIQQSNWDNAKWLLENGSVFPDYVIYQSKGKQGKRVYLKTDIHYYCY